MVIGHISSSLLYAHYLRIKNFDLFMGRGCCNKIGIIQLMMATLEYRLEQCYVNISNCIIKINVYTKNEDFSVICGRTSDFLGWFLNN